MVLPSAEHRVPLRETEQQGETLRKLPKDKSQDSISSVVSELTLWDIASSREGGRETLGTSHLMHLPPGA